MSYAEASESMTAGSTVLNSFEKKQGAKSPLLAALVAQGCREEVSTSISFQGYLRDPGPPHAYL